MKPTLERPAEPAGELYLRTDISPEQIFQAIGRLRREARDEIDRLLQFLDETDDHMEREPDLGFPESHPTPYGGHLGQTRTREGDQSRLSAEHIGGTDDREIDGDDLDASYPEDLRVGRLCDPNEDAEDDGTAEPSLGSVEGPSWGRRRRHGQESWASGNTDDREGDDGCDDREGDELRHGGEATDEDDERGGDEEPSLGWPIEGSQNSALACQDLEEGEPARRPQNRTRVATPMAALAEARRHVSHHVRWRFERAIAGHASNVTLLAGAGISRILPGGELAEVLR